ncbi:1,4-alpha-glucan branching protein GlgB [Tautonia sociabilis]|uniref:1,4-alpha-glucan branching protein GlgB n=1 Tax=Tautonia sociabilis TaxID=2080755 RepID=UPI0013155961|nr:1,4-alpha-glucan branching protein GlgB [Tautonia sociabilis]
MSPPRADDQEVERFLSGNSRRAFEWLGARLSREEGADGARFATWAPSARGVSVVGDFNEWNPAAHPLREREGTGIWEGFVPGIALGQRYQFAIAPAGGGPILRKADPYALLAEPSPGTASQLWDLSGFDWGDGPWMLSRSRTDHLGNPLSIYEVHLGSWLPPEPDGSRRSYRELAPRLADTIAELGFTHIELMPLAEHPFTGSWGYQVTGYYAPTSRYGRPQDLMAFVDHFHRRGIGVILDWVPGHFPRDPHGLSRFDGTFLYEYDDPRKREHGEWGTDVFDYQKGPVVSFLISNALFWLEHYHFDGLRVDAVSSMLYLDYARRPGQWATNRYGGRENTEAIRFLRRLNEAVHACFPGVLTIAEESTSWPGVTRPTDRGGLGFDLKWDLGWMHDIVNDYLRLPPERRPSAADQLTIRSRYMFEERYVLPLSHDEVVHGKGSLVGKMPGDDHRRFANVRLLLGHQFAQPGRPLLFMGGEFGQRREWDHDRGLDWELLDLPAHFGLRRWVRDLTAFCRAEPAVFRLQDDPRGFEWVDHQGADRGVISFLRRGPRSRQVVLFVFNFLDEPRVDERVGVPLPGRWAERLNSDSAYYGGGNIGNLGGVQAQEIPWQRQPYSVVLTLPPLAMLVLVPAPEASDSDDS